MSTTVEMKPEHRSALLLSPRRGQKGFSDVLEDAIENYLAGEAERERKERTLLLLAGSISEEEAWHEATQILYCLWTEKLPTEQQSYVVSWNTEN